MSSEVIRISSFADPKAFEKFPNYFKYRFINRTDFVIGVIMETQVLTPAVNLYYAMKEYIDRAFNVNVIFDWIPFQNLVNFKCSTNLSSNGNLIDYLFVPSDAVTLYGCQEAYPTSIFTFSETVIVTAEPTLNIVPSLNLLKMENMVTVLFVVLCCIISLFMTASISRPSRSFPTNFLYNFWDTFFTFFYEPYPNLSSVSSVRIACVSWLIGVLIISIELSSSLKAEFSIKTYDTMSSLEDLADHHDVKPYVMRNAIEFRYISFMRNQKRHMKQLYTEIADNNRFLDLLEDMIQDDFYFKLADTRDKMALVIHREYLNRVLGFDLQNIKERECPGTDEEPCSLNDLPRIQIGVDDEKRDTMTLIRAKHIQESKFAREIGDLTILVLFETKCADFYDFQNAYNLEFVTWKPPVESFHAQKLSDMREIFFMFFYMSLLTILVFLLEIISWNLKLYCKSSSKQRREKCKVSIQKRINSIFVQY